MSIGGMWEGEWDIIRDVECGGIGWVEPCKHCRDVTRTLVQYPAGEEVEVKWICPTVVEAFCDAGWASTGVCAECIVEAMSKLKVPSDV